MKLNKSLRGNELFMTGCATNFCVESTIQSALAKDYNITVVSDGHTTGERPHLSAEKVIEHYNWVWQNMIPTKGKIEVKLFEHIKKTFSKVRQKTPLPNSPPIYNQFHGRLST